MSATAAQIAGAVGALGLALLVVAPRRDLRVAGLAAWALGCGGARRLPRTARASPLLAAAAVVGVLAAAVGDVARAARAVAARARDARLRARAHPGARRLDAGEPAAAALRRRRRRGARARLGAVRRRASRTRELGPLAWPRRAPSSAGTALSLLWSKDVRQGAIELLFFVLPFGLLAVALARLVWSRALGAGALRAARADGARLRRDRDRPVRDAQHLLEPEGAASTTPTRRAAGSTGSTRSSTTRRSTAASSCVGDPREPRRRPVGGAARLAVGGRRDADDRDHLGRACCPSFSQSSFVALGGRDRRRAPSSPGAGAASSSLAARPWSCSSSVASPQLRHRIRGKAVALARDERPLDARLDRDEGRAAPPRDRRRGRRLQARLRRARRTCAARSRRPPPRTRRRSPSRPRPGLPGLAALRSGSSSWRSASASGGLGSDFDGSARLAFGLALVAIARAQPLLQRALRGPDLLGPARARSRVVGACAPERERRRPDVIDGCRARARARAAHRRRRVRLRRHDGAPRRGGRRRALRRLLDRDPLAARGLRARHARARGARGDRRARHPAGEPDRARLRRAHVPRPPPGDPRAADRDLERLEARRASSSRRCTTSTRTTRRSRARGCAPSSARRSSATRSPGTTSTSATRPTSRSSSGTSSARWRRSRGTRRSSTAATRTPSTSGTSPARTAST